jgi:hypothetical protein
MSLHHIAQHLKDQGRGPDDMLVHMTSGEVAAMQNLAKAHGGSLTVNPQTGLPEAGFLSSVLPMALGAVAVATGQLEFLPYIAAGVGVADYALTGSLTQGLMAGLGTWSGGSLASGFATTGAEEAAKNAAEGLAPTVSTVAPPPAPVPTPGGGLVPNPADLNNAATVAEDAAGYSGSTNGVPNQVEGTKAFNPNPTDAAKNEALRENMLRGASSFSNIGQTIMNNKAAALGAALPLLSGTDILGNLTGTKKGPIAGVNQSSGAGSNPFGLKTIPRDSNGNPIFNASIPAQPNPAYQATYPNYVANPYNAYGAAAGGVMKMAVGGSAPMIGTPAQNTTMNSSVGNNTMFPMSEMARSYYATPTQLPAGINAQTNPNPAGQNTDGQIPGYGPRLDTNTGQMMNNFADGGLANLPYVQQSQNQPGTANGYTPAGGGSTYGQGQFSPQTTAMQPMGLNQAPFTQMGMPPTQFAQGGVAQYAGKYESMVSGLQDIKEGADIATRRPVMDTPRADVGIYEDESDVRNLDAYNRTQALLKKAMTSSHVKPSKGLPKSAVLGALDMTPAQQAAAEQQAKASIAKDSDTSEVKEGGLMRYADGGNTALQPTIANPNNAALFNALGVNPATGQAAQTASYTPTTSAPSTGLDESNLAKAFAVSTAAAQQSPSVYQPKYNDYLANPFNMQQAGQSYSPQAIPTPAGLPMLTQNNSVGAAGYKIDPMQMVGSPAYKAEQDRLAAEKKAAEEDSHKGMHQGFAGQWYTDTPPDPNYAKGGYLNGYAMGGHLGGYSDGGHLLKGPGDGVSDSIPATIGGKQPARLAEGEFVIPARIVSELGNGSTDAGAKRLYAMMDRIKAKRSKAKNIAANTKAYKYLPA